MASPLVDFRYFGCLPPEVRCEIWKYSAPGPRFVAVKYQTRTCTYTPRISPPTLLQVNLESRQEGLKIYHELRLGPGPNIGCYVDLTRDTVYVSSDITDDTGHPVNTITSEHESSLPSQIAQTAIGHGLPGASQIPRILSPSPGPATLPTSQFHDLPALSSFPSPISDLDRAMDQGQYIAPQHINGNETFSRSHWRIIFDHLLSSPDGRVIYQRLHIAPHLWKWIRKRHIVMRHELPYQMKELHLIHERGTGPLGTKAHFKDAVWDQDLEMGLRPPTWPEDGILWRTVSSYRAQNKYRNRRDRQEGRPSVLNYSISLKILQRD